MAAPALQQRQGTPGRLHGAAFPEGVAGNPQYWRTCQALFMCGSPLATDAGMDDLPEGNAETARQMLRKTGYDGAPIVVLQSSDALVLTNST
jgi:peptide/nickel transport system substrate-binding protein